MKQTVKEASCTHWNESTYKEDAELAYDKHECTAVTALASKYRYELSKLAPNGRQNNFRG